MAESRVKKSLLNAKVNMIFYMLTLMLSFFSRKIFLDCLGADFVGLTGTLQNLLGFLNLAELGIGAAIGYVLYKPLFYNNQQEINEIISVFGYLYRRIGRIILILGGLLACFLPMIFPNTRFELGVIYATYFSFLASSLIGYFINYKQTLLGADQKNYVIVGWFQSTNIVKILIQMLSAWYTGNYYLWVTIELGFGIFYSFILNWRIRITYPWLKSEIRNGKDLRKKHGIIITKSKQLFVHKLAGVARFQFLPFLIYVFSSLEVVALYGNYSLIVDKVATIIENILGSTQAGVGNLITEGSKDKIMNVFWELNMIRYFIAGTCVFSVYYMIDPFVCLWIGKEYVLERSILILILINLFFVITRGTNDQFLFGYGLFQDTWASIISVVMTVLLGLILGYFLGLTGVLLGNVIGLAVMLYLWKPYFLYSRGFKCSVLAYWKGVFKLLLPIGCGCFLSIMILDCLNLNRDTVLMWIISGIFTVCILCFSNLILLTIINKKLVLNIAKRFNIVRL